MRRAASVRTALRHGAPPRRLPPATSTLPCQPTRPPKPRPAPAGSSAPGRAELRDETLPPLADGEVRVRTLHSGVSRGTEGLVFRGEVPASEYQRMRAPFQGGDFPAPVKYGYASVGVVEARPGDAAAAARCSACTRTRRATRCRPTPCCRCRRGVPPARAVLAALTGDRRQRAVGRAAAHRRPHRRGRRRRAGPAGGLAGGARAGLRGAGGRHRAGARRRRRGAGRRLRPARRRRARCRPRDPRQRPAPPGLATALRLAAFEATVLELSWYGSRAVAVPLGEAFHARRLRAEELAGRAASPRAQRGRWSHRRRLALALVAAGRPGARPPDHAQRALRRRCRRCWRGWPRPTARADTLCQRIDYPPAKAG